MFPVYMTPQHDGSLLMSIKKQDKIVHIHLDPHGVPKPFDESMIHHRWHKDAAKHELGR